MLKTKTEMKHKKNRTFIEHTQAKKAALCVYRFIWLIVASSREDGRWWCSFMAISTPTHNLYISLCDQIDLHLTTVSTNANTLVVCEMIERTFFYSSGTFANIPVLFFYLQIYSIEVYD